MNTRLLRSEHQRRVDDFMRLAKQGVPDRPTEPTEAVRLLRAKLIFEEAMETIEKGLGVCCRVIDDVADFTIAGPFDLLETIDGCCDLSVVTVGTLTAVGIPDEPFLKLTDENNLAKFGPGHTIRADGKLIKPPGHRPPDIAGKLAEIMR
jgi:predicted HAD superfamily Cof-like phosphohydrolase